MLFKNANIFVGGQFQHGSFRVENGKFAEILTTVPAEDGIDLNNQYVIPGLVDVHNHGNSGADFSDGDYDGLVKMARYLAQNGVTSFAPASMTLPYDVLEAAYKTAVQLKKAQPEGCARLIGIQMEGPFFSEKKKGAQNGAYLRDPDFTAFKRLYDVSEGLLRIADVAAELPGAVEFTEKAFKLFPGRICLISDALRCCGMPDGQYTLGGQDVFLYGGVAKLADGTLAGSATNLYDCMRKAVEFGIPKEQAILSATLIPAREIGREKEIGSIESGKLADFVVCDEELSLVRVFTGGKQICE